MQLRRIGPGIAENRIQIGLYFRIDELELTLAAVGLKKAVLALKRKRPVADLDGAFVIKTVSIRPLTTLQEELAIIDEQRALCLVAEPIARR